MIRRIAGMLTRPRAIFAELARQPAWAGTWLVVLAIWAICGASLLLTDVGRQAVVDERVRVIESVGGTVDDAAYAALMAAPPWWVYFTSGGRLLLLPPVTLAVALVCWVAARRAPGVSYRHALAMVVHASVVLIVAQVIATPIHFVRESLTSPINMAAILPLMEDGTVPARFFGSIDLFAVWWAALIAVGLSVLTGRRVSRYAAPLAALFAAFAAVVAAVSAVLGGM